MIKNKSFLIPALCLILTIGSVLSVYAGDASKSVARNDVHEDGELTKRELKIISNDLNDIGYYGFLLSDYKNPKNIVWDEVFYNGAGLAMDKVSKKIKDAYLKETGETEIYTDLTVIPGEDLRDYVKKTTGMSYTKMKYKLDWIYLDLQDVYCFEHGDTNQVNVDVISGSVKDGVYTVRYTHNNWWGDNADCEYEVCYTMEDDYYCFISNIPDKSSGSRSTSRSDYLIPDSDSRYIDEEDLRGMDKETLRRARNEIYARHGRKFKDSSLQSYFNRQSWYNPKNVSDNKIEKSLNKYEKANIKFLSSYEKKK